jgi:predicted ester cyclase
MATVKAKKTTEEWPTRETLVAEYQEICKSHEAIADFRGRLLGLLPLASGTGIFLLVYRQPAADSSGFLVAAGLFGAVVTLGLYLYEKRGMSECLLLRERGAALECRLRLSPDVARFRNNPSRFVGPQGAGPIVYFAVMAAWIFVALYGLSSSYPRVELEYVVVIAIAYLTAVLIAAGRFIKDAARRFTKDAHKTAEAKRIVERFIEELWDHRRSEVAKETLERICTPHMVSWLFAADSRHGNALSFRDAFLRAFPDQVTCMHRMTAKRQPDGSVLVDAWSSFSGTHRGQLYNNPATDRQVTVHGYQSFRIEDGKITDYWPLWDWRGLFGQLELAVPVPTGVPTGLQQDKGQHVGAEGAS